MNTLVTSWALSALSYDEKGITKRIKTLFPHLKPRFKHDHNGSHFYGAVADDINGVLYIVNRGTDGFNHLGRFKSWARNLRLLTSGDGVHNGFQDAGNRVVDDFKNGIYNYETVVACGHSQGAGITQYILCILAENFSNLRCIHGDVFASPPTFNITSKKRFLAHSKKGAITLDRYLVDGDPIDSEILRNQKGAFLKGVDVGNEIILPTIVMYDLGLANVIKHSCRIYNAGLLQMCAADDRFTHDELKILAAVGDTLVN